MVGQEWPTYSRDGSRLRCGGVWIPAFAGMTIQCGQRTSVWRLGRARFSWAAEKPVATVIPAKAGIHVANANNASPTRVTYGLVEKSAFTHLVPAQIRAS